MAEKPRILHEGEQERFLYHGKQDGIVYCKLKDYFRDMEFAQNPHLYEFMDDDGGKWADKRYISRKYHLGEGTVEVILLSNEHLLVVSNPPDLDLGNVEQAVPELRELPEPDKDIEERISE